MSVALLLITHDRIGDALLDTARRTLGVCPLRAECLSVPQDADPDDMTAQAATLVERLEQGDGVLLLTDAYGSTPSNIACRMRALPGTAVVTGINLPMLLRVLNYPTLDLRALRDKALTGGQDGVLLVDC
ncbi:PTS sugar transporter subunit IIA [Alkalilimnicola sp. S0819]|uniref:PTS sugar transporter subunit IIA n=1 Tax=Alkalilimnicola sp. S0819 TaxID=2613922 RepID=UPI001261D77F|nr:PTS fructose transporter subunit IIA [Alkalilimnicola sp. S0819]KAB7623817.1 PTS fructose transporter subunit IIA [Alkalilimnicola sp. S0819]MPQ16691.1 PTS fructose transporter subunit IIA [Alkalilimnicola sp. S0819]